MLECSLQYFNNYSLSDGETFFRFFGVFFDARVSSSSLLSSNDSGSLYETFPAGLFRDFPPPAKYYKSIYKVDFIYYYPMGLVKILNYCLLNYKFKQSRLTSFGASSAPTVTSTASWNRFILVWLAAGLGRRFRDFGRPGISCFGRFWLCWTFGIALVVLTAPTSCTTRTTWNKIV